MLVCFVIHSDEHESCSFAVKCKVTRPANQVNQYGIRFSAMDLLSLKLLQYIIALSVIQLYRLTTCTGASIGVGDAWVHHTSFSSSSIVSSHRRQPHSIYSYSASPEVHDNSVDEVQLPGVQTTTIAKCSRAGYLENPINCGKFYNCIKFGSEYQLFSLNCVEGTIFYAPLSKCISPEIIRPRMRPICTSASSATATAVAKATGLSSIPRIQPETSTVAYGAEDTVGSLFEFDGPSAVAESIEEMEDDDYAPLPGNAITQHEIDIFVPVDATRKNYSRTSNMEEFDYSDEPIGINLLDSMTNLQAGEFHDIELPMRNRLRPPLVNSKVPTPKVWFGFRSKDPSKPVVNSIGNPFKDDETTLAVILDFATSRLQIYSKNKPPR